jgi:glycosyltransferase 2 family protein
MDRKRMIVTGVVLVVLAALVYIQFRTWKDFNWQLFLSQTDRVSPFHILHAVALIYVGYWLRAIRWKIFLRPVRPEASSSALVAPTLIGFTGLALLGRPGELIRPYLIARHESLPFSSQLGVWAVERIFDIGAFTVWLILAAFVATAPKRMALHGIFQEVALAFTILVVGLTLGAIAVHRSGEFLSQWIERRFAHLPSNLGERVALRIREFRDGLNTIHSTSSLLQLVAVSLVMWAMIAVAYKEVTHAYGHSCDPVANADVCKLEIPQTQVLLLMGSSMVGSMIQLPGVGGGSQLATISMLDHVFEVKPELAASCGIMLWLVTFMAIVPLGLFLAHRERLSLRKLSEESHQAEKTGLPVSPPSAS